MRLLKNPSNEAVGIHNEAVVIDLHCHPSLKTGLYGYKIYDRRHFIAGNEIRNSPDDEMLQMQYDLYKMYEGKIDVILSSVYLLEKGMVDNSNLHIVEWIANVLQVESLENSVERYDYSGPGKDEQTIGPYVQALEAIEKMNDQVNSARSQGFSVLVAKNFNELEKALRKNEMCILHSLEGAHMLGRNLNLDEYLLHLETLLNQGVCLITLGHFMPNNVCFPCNGISPKTKRTMNFRYDYSAFVKNGLLKTGKEIVSHMFDLGIIVDLCHVNAKGRSEIYKLNKSRASSSRPLVFSHNGVRKFCRYEMLTPDDFEIKEIQNSNGIIGVIFMNYWLTGKEKKPDDGIENIVRVIKYIAEVCGGSYDNIGIGTDMDGFTQPVDDLYMPSQMIRLTQALLDAGISGDNILKILGGNALRVLREGWGKQ